MAGLGRIPQIQTFVSLYNSHLSAAKAALKNSIHVMWDLLEVTNKSFSRPANFQENDFSRAINEIINKNTTGTLSHQERIYLQTPVHTSFLLKNFVKHVVNQSGRADLSLEQTVLALALAWGSSLVQVATRYFLQELKVTKKSGQEKWNYGDLQLGAKKDEITLAFVNRLWDSAFALRDSCPELRELPSIHILKSLAALGQNTTIAMIDRKPTAQEDNHHAITTSIAAKARQAHIETVQNNPYAVNSVTGHDGAVAILKAIEDATVAGTTEICLPCGISWDTPADRSNYLKGRNEAEARELYEKDRGKIIAAMSQFPGLVVVAAGNGGMLTECANTILAFPLDIQSRATNLSFMQQAGEERLKSALGICPRVIAVGNDGSERKVDDDASSWATALIGAISSVVASTGIAPTKHFESFGRVIKNILLLTSEVNDPFELRHVDPALACCFAKIYLYCKKHYPIVFKEKFAVYVNNPSDLQNVLTARNLALSLIKKIMFSKDNFELDVSIHQVLKENKYL